MFDRTLSQRGWDQLKRPYQEMKKRTAKPRDCSDAEKRQLVTLVRDGISIRAIAAALGRRANFVRMMAQEMKLINRKKGKRPSDYSKGKGVAPSTQRGPTCVTIGQ